MGTDGVDRAATLGIDLASQPASTGACVVCWRDGAARVAYLARGRDGDGRDLDDVRLLELMTGPGPDGSWPVPAVIGIDAPLGWPAPFVAAVADPDAWPLEDEQAPEHLVRRAGDRWVHQQTGKLPLSVSTDRIAYPAMRAQRLLRRLRAATGEAVDRAGVDGRVCEVYPDPAATRFGLRGAGRSEASYKTAAGVAMRAVMLERLRALAPWLDLEDDQAALCVAVDDAFDALLCALIARARQLGRTTPPLPGLEALAAAEGWIHVPEPGALDGLVGNGA